MDALWVKKGWIEIDVNGQVVFTPGRWDTESSADAIRHLLEKVLPKLDPKDLTVKIIQENGLSRPLQKFFGGRSYRAVTAAFPEIQIKPWEMKSTAKNFFKSKQNRVEAIKWLADVKLEKDPRKLTLEDFRANRLAGLLRSYYSDSPYYAIREAYPELNINFSDMHRTPRKIHDYPQILLDEIRCAVESTGKPGREIRQHELKISKPAKSHFGPRLFDILHAAGVVTEEDKEYIEGRGIPQANEELRRRRLAEAARS